MLLAFYALFLAYPLAHVLLGAFSLNGACTVHFFAVMFGTEVYREVLYNSFNIALTVTILSSVSAYLLALLLGRLRLPGSSVLHTLLVVPLVVPPFVGVLGVRQLLGRFGSINMLLLNAGIITHPIDWLGAGNVVGIIFIQVIHLTPILYLSIRASLQNAHISLEEAAIMSGASRSRVLAKVILPLSLPSWFAGATVVFIASFADLGTPLLFEYRDVVSVQIYSMLSELTENPLGYSFVVSTCILSIALFSLSKASVLYGGFAGPGREHQGLLKRDLSQGARVLALSLITGYALIACVPQVMVVLVALSENWFMSALPHRWTTAHFIEILTHPLTTRSMMISLGLSLAASACTVVVGFLTAYVISRGRTFHRYLFEVLSLIPLAVPGLVLAVGFLNAFTGTLLDNRINPFPLLIVAYTVRRLPTLIRSVCAGLQESSRSLEEAASMVGASPIRTTVRITLPLVRRHLAVGAMLTFAYSMIEVSDSLLLALETKFYPIAKAIYFLTGRPDGYEVASALGVIVMMVMLCTFYVAERISTRTVARKTMTALLIAFLVIPRIASAEPQDVASDIASDELIVVSPHWEAIRKEFEHGFNTVWRARTGRDVRFRWLDIGGASDIVKYIKSQQKRHPEGVGIDLFFGGGSDSFIELEKTQALATARIASHVLRAIPSSLSGVPLYSPQHTWFANALSAYGILYNKAAIERLGLPVPSTWRDLGKPEYYGYVGAGDPRKSGSMHAMYEIILQGYGWGEGWRILQRIARNVRHFSGGASHIGKEVALGELLYGIAIDTYAGDIIRQVGEARLGYVLPSDFAAVNGESIGMIRGAPHPEVASAFIEFTLSEVGQRLWYARRGTPGGPLYSELGKLSVLPALYGTIDPAGVVKDNPFTMSNVFSYNSFEAGERWTLVNDLFGVFVIDAHKRLVRAGPGSNLPGVPLSEDEARLLWTSGSWSDDPARRTEYIRSWTEQARERVPRESSLLERIRWVPTVMVVSILVLGLTRHLRRVLYLVRNGRTRPVG
jgi:iron(III) transport system permease protein